MESFRVLVADDDDEMRSGVAGILRAEGIDVVEAPDGEAALELIDSAVDIARMRPDLVITDVRMPRFSGLGVLDMLRRAQLDLPVILMTGLTDQSVTAVAKRMGAVDVLRKPFDADALLSSVQKARARVRVMPREAP